MIVLLTISFFETFLKKREIAVPLLSQSFMSYPVYNSSPSHTFASSVETLRQSLQIPLWICHLREMCLRITDSLNPPGHSLGSPWTSPSPLGVEMGRCMPGYWERTLIRLIVCIYSSTPQFFSFSFVVCSLCSNQWRYAIPTGLWVMLSLFSPSECGLCTSLIVSLIWTATTELHQWRPLFLAKECCSQNVREHKIKEMFLLNWLTECGCSSCVQLFRGCAVRALSSVHWVFTSPWGTHFQKVTMLFLFRASSLETDENLTKDVCCDFVSEKQYRIWA